MAILNYLGSDNKYHALPIGETVTATEPESYSTEEQVIGQWIDGKPIYRKVFKLTAPVMVKDSQWVDMKINAQDMDRIIYGCIQNRFSVQHYGFWADRDTNPSAPTLKIISSRTQDILYDTFENDGSTVVIEYTKMTDDPNSFSIDMLTTISLDSKATPAEVAFCI